MTMLWKGQWIYLPSSGLSRFLRLAMFLPIPGISFKSNASWGESGRSKSVFSAKICISNLPDRFVREAYKPDIEGRRRAHQMILDHDFGPVPEDSGATPTNDKLSSEQAHSSCTYIA